MWHIWWCYIQCGTWEINFMKGCLDTKRKRRLVGEKRPWIRDAHTGTYVTQLLVIAGSLIANKYGSLQFMRARRASWFWKAWWRIMRTACMTRRFRQAGMIPLIIKIPFILYFSINYLKIEKDERTLVHWWFLLAPPFFFTGGWERGGASREKCVGQPQGPPV